MDENLILKYLTSECTREELEQVNHWLDESPDNQKWLFDLETLWRKREFSELSDQCYLDDQFERTLKKIASAEQTAAGQKPNFLTHFARIATWVAACVVAAAIIWPIYLSVRSKPDSQFIVESVSVGNSIRRVMLPDSTIVWLKSNSELRYTQSFNEKERCVVLDGDAYFSVKKDTGKPFRVETPEYTVKVLGTKFNVSSSKTKQTIETILFSGKVVIENQLHEELLALAPGQKLSYSKLTKHMSIENVDSQTSAELRANTCISFKNETVNDIVDKLNYIYGVTITVDQKLSRASASYTGSVACEDSLENLLKGLQKAIPFSFAKDGNGRYVLTSSD